MAIDTFTWCVQVQGAGGTAVSNNVRSVIMGNGYEQLASSGRNTNRREYSLVYAGKDYIDVYDFLLAHVTKPFIFTPPDGRISIFTTKPDTVSLTVVSGKIQAVNCTLREQFTRA